MKPGVMLINTSRSALIDTQAANVVRRRVSIAALKSGKIGYLGKDVYEQEEELFFENLSDRVITDDVFLLLLTFPNVLITGHQAFFTANAPKGKREDGGTGGMGGPGDFLDGETS